MWVLFQLSSYVPWQECALKKSWIVAAEAGEFGVTTVQLDYLAGGFFEVFLIYAVLTVISKRPKHPVESIEIQAPWFGEFCTQEWISYTFKKRKVDRLTQPHVGAWADVPVGLLRFSIGRAQAKNLTYLMPFLN